MELYYKIKIAANNYQAFWIISIMAEITGRKKIERSLKRTNAEIKQRVKELTLELDKKNQQLKSKTNELEKINAAFSVLLKKREQDRIDIEEAVLSNFKYSICPYIQKLKQNNLKNRQIDVINIIEENLNEIVSPMMHKLSKSFNNLTPREIQIANLIKIGKTTKEIAIIDGLSERTVEFHRDNLRKKLGLKNKKINLRTHLLSLG